jgi:hypothetical protein
MMEDSNRMKARNPSPLFTAVAIMSVVGSAMAVADEVLSVPLREVASRMECPLSGQPLAFEENLGQVDPEVQFLSRGPGYQLFLTETEAVMVLSQAGHRDASFRVDDSCPPSNPLYETNGDGGLVDGPPAVTAPHALRMRSSGTSSIPVTSGDKPLRGKANYFIGNDPSRWRTNISTFAKVHYRDLYPGTDLVYYRNEGRLEYDFVVSPGPNPDQITLLFEGADRMELDAAGDLIVWVAGRPVRWRKPVVYQEHEGRRVEIAAIYRVRTCSESVESEGGDVIGFEVVAYDHTKPLVIDPVLVYSTYLGGALDDGANASAVDGQGNLYIAGRTTSINFPSRAALKPAISGSSDAVVSKLSPTGELLYSTYLGGGGDSQYSEAAYGLAVNAVGNCYVVGQTASMNFPLVNPIQTVPGGNVDGFVAALKPDGSALMPGTSAYSNEVSATAKKVNDAGTGAPASAEDQRSFIISCNPHNNCR